MVRIFQDTQGEIIKLVDRSIEQIICLDGVDCENIFTNIFLIWLKLKSEGSWHRIFLDAGGCLCEAYDDAVFAEKYAEDIDNCEDCPIYQINSRFSLQGLTIISASVSSFNIDRGGIQLKIFFDNGDSLILQSEEVESGNNLLIIKS